MANTQLHKHMTGYQHVIQIYSSLSNTDKAYIQRGTDARATKIRELLKKIKAHRHVESLADELLPLLVEVRELGKGE